MKSKQAITISNVAVRQMVNSIFNVVLPFVVIHFAAKQIWGEFVSVLLFVLIASTCNNFGNKEYLLRQFSAQPKNIRLYFTENLYTRIPVLLLTTLIAFFLFPLPFAGFISLSLVGIYISQSYEAVIIFEKKFGFSAIAEMLFGLLFLMTLMLFRNTIDAFFILELYAGMQVLKALVYTFSFRSVFKKTLPFNLSFYKNCFPFFLLTLMGFLASKVDVYLVDFFLSKSKLAEYQILNNLCLFAMGTAGFFYIPFSKNIYRNREIVIQGLKTTLFILGFVVTGVAILIIYVVIHFYLKTVVPGYFYGLVFMYIFPSFLYGIEIISLFKRHKEMKVVKYLFTGILMNMVVSALLLYSGLDITGAILGSAVAQLVVLGLFLSEKEKPFAVVANS